MQLCSSLSILWHCLSLGLEWKLTFSSPVTPAEFSKFADNECSTFTASSFRIWNSSTGIPSPPLALFVVMLPKAHLTSHSRMSGSRWVIIPSWLSGSWRYFWKSSSVYSCHLILMFCFCSVHTFSVLYCAHLCMKCFLGISDFPQEISSLSHSIVLLYFFALITEEGFLISLLFSGTLHSDGYTFPFLLWLSLLFFSSLLFSGLLRQPFCLFAFLFLGDGLDHHLLYNVTNLHP